jgi:hypothetical protein
MKYSNYKLSELKKMAKNLKLKGYSKLNKEDLISLIKKSNKSKKSGGALISYNNIKSSNKSINNKIKNILNSNNPDYIKSIYSSNNIETKTNLLRKLTNNIPDYYENKMQTYKNEKEKILQSKNLNKETKVNMLTQLSHNKEIGASENYKLISKKNDNKKKILNTIKKITGSPLNNMIDNGLLDWINIENLTTNLSYNENPNVINLLKTNPNKIDYFKLAINPNAIKLLQKEIKKRHGLYCDELYENPNIAYLLFNTNTKDIDWSLLSSNPGAIELLKKQIRTEKFLPKYKYESLENKVDWSMLSMNSNAIKLLNENLDKIDWFYLSYNKSPQAINLITEQFKKENLYRKIDWGGLSMNSNAIDLLKENPKKIDWELLSTNSSPEAIKLLKENKDKIDWKLLSANSSPDAIKLLKENDDKIDWKSLSGNSCPYVIKLLEEKIKLEPDKIDWSRLSGNPLQDVIDLLEANQDKIDWDELSKNPSIFKKYDYNKMKQKRNNTGISNEIKYRLPNRFETNSEENYKKKMNNWAKRTSKNTGQRFSPNWGLNNSNN